MSTPEPYSFSSFSVFWTDNPNFQGINPPSEKFVKSENIQGLSQQTQLAGPGKTNSYPVGLIQSKRQPFAVQHLTNEYGSLSSRLGTNIGS